MYSQVGDDVYVDMQKVVTAEPVGFKQQGGNGCGIWPCYFWALQIR